MMVRDAAVTFVGGGFKHYDNIKEILTDEGLIVYNLADGTAVAIAVHEVKYIEYTATHESEDEDE